MAARTQASPAAQLDLFNYMSVATKDPQEEVRVVNTNHRPADMREVKVEVFIEGGKPMARAVPDVAAVPESSANDHLMF